MYLLHCARTDQCSVVNCNCLPTKNSRVLKNSLKRVRAFQIELKFGSVGFYGEGKTGVTGGKANVITAVLVLTLSCNRCGQRYRSRALAETKITRRRNSFPFCNQWQPLLFHISEVAQRLEIRDRHIDCSSGDENGYLLVT